MYYSMDSLSHKILMTLAKGDTRIQLTQLKQQFSPQEFHEQCEMLIYNKAVTNEGGYIFMTPRQKHNAKLIYGV